MKKQFPIYAITFLIATFCFLNKAKSQSTAADPATSFFTTGPNTPPTIAVPPYLGWTTGTLANPFLVQKSLDVKNEENMPIIFYTQAGLNTYLNPRMQIFEDPLNIAAANAGFIGIGDATLFQPQSLLHQHGNGPVAPVPFYQMNYHQFTNQLTGAGTANTGFSIGTQIRPYVFGTIPADFTEAMLVQHENSPMKFWTHDALRMVINADAIAPINGVNQSTAGYVGIGDGTIMSEELLGGLGPRSLLHLQGPNNTIFGGNGWRSWMRTGTYLSENSDEMYLGLKNEFSVNGTNRSDATLMWGDDQFSFGDAQADNFRIIFTGVAQGYGSGTNPLSPFSFDGLEVVRINPLGRMGVGPLFTWSTPPSRRLELLDYTDTLGNSIDEPQLRLTYTQANAANLLPTGLWTDFQTIFTGDLVIHPSNTGAFQNVGINTGFSASPGNLPPGNTLEIDAIAGGVFANYHNYNGGVGGIGTSGLRFNDMSQVSTPSPPNISNTVLSVDGNGDVILVQDQSGGTQYGQCTIGAVTAIDHLGMNLQDNGPVGGWNIYHDGQDVKINTKLRQSLSAPNGNEWIFGQNTAFGIGYPCNADLWAKLSVEENIGTTVSTFPTTAGYFHNGDPADASGWTDFVKRGVYAVVDGYTINGDPAKHIGGDFEALNAEEGSNIGVRGRSGVNQFTAHPANYDFIGGQFEADPPQSNPTVNAVALEANVRPPEGNSVVGTRTVSVGQDAIGIRSNVAGGGVTVGRDAFGMKSTVGGGTLGNDATGVDMTVDGNMPGSANGITALIAPTGTIGVDANGLIMDVGSGTIQNDANGIEVTVGSGTITNDVNGMILTAGGNSVGNNANGIVLVTGGTVTNNVMGMSLVAGGTVGGNATGIDVVAGGSVPNGDIVGISINAGGVALNNVTGLIAGGNSGGSNFAYGVLAGGNGAAINNIGVTATTMGGGSGVNYGIMASGPSNCLATAGACTDAAGYFNGDIATSAGWWQASDMKLKRNIKPLENCLQVINKLQPKSYEFKNAQYPTINLSLGIQAGLIADSVEVIPELSNLVRSFKSLPPFDSLGHYDNSKIEEVKMLNYIQIIPYLIGAINQQEQKIDSVKASQQQTIDDLTNKLHQLEAIVNGCCTRTGGEDDGKSRIANPNGNANAIDVNLSNANSIVLALDQNFPNPFAEKTTITYSVPDGVNSAVIMFYDNLGRILQSVTVNQRGAGQLNVFAGNLSSGIYSYSLIADGKVIDTKKMVCDK